jgi:hypothetical protein
MDLHLAAEACIDAAKEFPKVTWMFLGDAPWFADCMPDYAVRVAPSLDPMEYFQFIKQIKPTLSIVPLDDCVFNRSKSNCAWIEASWAGAATLAPAWPEWAKPGITNYQNKDDFGAKLRCLLRENVQVHAARARTSWEHVEANLSLSKINERRLKIMEGLGL